MIKISIALATYNGEKYIREQLDSILNQKYQNIEICISDDCSNDGTITILEEYFNKYSNILLSLNKSNLGFIKNFEKAISMCSGDYIALSDQDDIWLETKLDVLLKLIGNNSVIFSDAFVVDCNLNVIHNSFNIYSGHVCDNKNSFAKLLHQNFVTGCTMMFKNDIVNDILNNKNIFSYHDWWIAFIGSCRNGIKYIPDKLVKYRQHNNNVSGAQKYIKGKELDRISYFINHFMKFFKDKKLSGEKRFLLCSDRLKFYKRVENLSFVKGENLKLLEDLIIYNSNFINSKIHFKAFILGLKYRKIIHNNKNIFINMLVDLVG